MNTPNPSIQKPLSVCTFYHYHPLCKKDLTSFSQTLLNQGKIEGIRGLILLSEEGMNATLTGPLCYLKRYLELIRECTGVPIQGRWQFSNLWGFKKLHVKIKKELVRFSQSELPPASSKTHLSPAEWEKTIKDGKSILLDIRNNYEVQLGRFQGALDLNLNQFKEFQKCLKQSHLSKDKNILIYCTGGIRCEKALSEMTNQGFQKVKQLKGGILNYLKQFPNSHFQGECFVFDHRVSLNQQLNPSGNYQLCPHCGQPGRQSILCKHCQSQSVICALCYKKSFIYQTCSKNCAYHYKKNHQNKKLQKQTSSPNTFR